MFAFGILEHMRPESDRVSSIVIHRIAISLSAPLLCLRTKAVACATHLTRKKSAPFSVIDAATAFVMTV